MDRPVVRTLALFLLVVPACSGDSPNKPKTTPVVTQSTLTIDTPARAAMIQDGDLLPSSVMVSGTATDSINAITSLVIEGQTIGVSGTDHEVLFSVQTQSRWGLTLLSGEATNSAGGRGEVAQSFLRSPSYFPPSTSAQASARVPDGYVARLRQEILDDEDRTDVDDLATVMNRVLAAQNWNSQIPVCLTNSGGGGDCVANEADVGCNEVAYAIRKNGTVSVGSVTVQYIHLTGGAQPRLTEQVRVTNPTIPVRVTAAASPLCVDVAQEATGSITADQVVVTMTHDLDVSAGQIVLKDVSVSTQWTNARVDVDFGVLSFLGGLVSTIASAGLNTFQNLFASTLSDAMAGMVPQALGSLSVPSQVTVGGGIQVGSAFTTAAVGVDNVTLGIGPQFYPVSPVKDLAGAPHGALRKDGGPATFPASNYSFGVAAKDDALNQFLWAAWASGAFDMGAVPNDACFTTGVGTVVSVEAMLPPVIMPGTGGHDLDIGFGDLSVVVDLAPSFASGASSKPGAGGAAPRATLYISWVGGASLDLDPESYKLIPALDAIPEVVVQVVGAEGAVDPTAWRDVVAQAMQCEYANRIEAALGAFPMPAIDIGFVAGVTPGTKLGLSSGVLERVGDYSVLTGTVGQMSRRQLTRR